MFCPNSECPDFVETGRPGEYTPEVAVCPVCGAYLVEHLQSDMATDSESEHALDRYRQPAPDEDFEPVYECTDPAEVPLIKSVLESEGIRFLTSGEERFDAFRGALSPFRLNPKAGIVRFLVPVAVADQTRALLTALEEPFESDENSSWDHEDEGSHE